MFCAIPAAGVSALQASVAGVPSRQPFEASLARVSSAPADPCEGQNSVDDVERLILDAAAADVLEALNREPRAMAPESIVRARAMEAIPSRRASGSTADGLKSHGFTPTCSSCPGW